MHNLSKLLFVVVLVVFASCKDEEAIPVLTVKDFTASIDENPENGKEIGKLEATTDFGAIKFQLESETLEGGFAVDESTGVLSVADSSLFDYEKNTSLEANIAAVNGEVRELIKVTVAVNNVFDDASEITVEDFTGTVTENPAVGTSLGVVSATAEGVSFTYHIKSESAAGSLRIDENTGELFVLDPAHFDFETNTMVEAEIEAVSQGISKTLTATIEVENMPRIDELKAGGQVIAYFPFAGNVEDEMGTVTDVDVLGTISLTEDRFGKADNAYKFEGGALSMPSFLDHPVLSASLWIKRAVNAEGAYHTFIAKTTPGRDFVFRLDRDKKVWFETGAPQYVGTSGYVNEAEWSHVVFTYNRGNVHIYLNGEEVGSSLNGNQIVWEATRKVTIGSITGTSETFIGDIDDVAFFSTELSTEEINEIMNGN